MVEKKTKPAQTGSETPSSVSLPPVSEETYNNLLITLGLEGLPTTVTDVDEKKWRENLSAVTKNMREVLEKIFGKETLEKSDYIRKHPIPFLQEIISAIDFHLKNNRSLTDAALSGVALVLEAYDRDYSVLSKLNTLSPEAIKNTDIARGRNINPKREYQSEYNSFLEELPKIPIENIYLERLVRIITGISRNTKQQHQILNPLLIAPMEFYMGASIMHKILEDSWGQLQESHKPPPYIIPLVVAENPSA